MVICSEMAVTTPLARRPSAGAVPGRWGACWAVRTPPAASRRSCGTVQETVLLLVPIRTHYFPRLFAEVPNDLRNSIARRTNAPPAIDLCLRPLVPAAGFRFVVPPLVLGQARSRGEPGVSQGQDDPLSGVARTVLQLARFLEHVDALPPGPHAIQGVAVHLQSKTVSDQFHVLEWRFQFIETDRLAVGGVGLVQLALAEQGVAEIGVGQGEFRIELDGLM